MYNHYKINENNLYFGEHIPEISVLPSDIYSVLWDEYVPGGPWFLQTFEPNTEDLIYLPDGPADHVNRSVDKFLTQETKDAFVRYGMLYKRGVLLYGAPGTGKTVIVHQLSEMAKKKDMIVLMNPPPNSVNKVVCEIREIEKNKRSIMIIWEDLDQHIDDNECNLLNLLDGYSQLENVFYVATTNYLDDVPARIRCRPSRFAEVIEVGPPSVEMRRVFFQKKIRPEDNIDLDEWVKKTEGFVIDQLKDVIISVLVLGLSLDDAVEKLKQMQKDIEEEVDYYRPCTDEPDRGYLDNDPQSTGL